MFKPVEGNSTNPYSIFIISHSFLLDTVNLNQSISVKLLLPIIPIGIVAYAFTLLLDNLCRNSCIGLFDRSLLHMSLNQVELP